MRVELVGSGLLRFADGTPVRAASAIAAYGEGWLIGQDDATHACWWRDGVGTPVRVVPAVEGHEVFSEAAGTKEHKPDLEAAVAVDGGVLLLGSGSTPARMRAALVRQDADPLVGDLSDLYARVAAALEVAPDTLNLEGACQVGGRLRWFQRGLPAAGVPTASVDVDLVAVLEALTGRRRHRCRGARRTALRDPERSWPRPGGHRRRRAAGRPGARQRGRGGQPQRLRRRTRPRVGTRPPGRRDHRRHRAAARTGRTGRQGRGPRRPRLVRPRRSRCSPRWTPTTPRCRPRC